MLPTDTLTPGDTPDPDKLHTLAMDAEKSLEQLSTGLGQIGADPQAVDTVTQMADVLRKIATGLAKNIGQPAAPAAGTPQHTMATAADAMMAAHHAAKAAAQQPPV